MNMYPNVYTMHKKRVSHVWVDGALRSLWGLAVAGLRGLRLAIGDADTPLSSEESVKLKDFRAVKVRW